MVEIFKTDDGSHSLKDKRTSETYHSDKGAVQESMHVYLQTGLLAAANGKTRLRLLEMGFGTGLNALITYLNKPNDLSIDYTAVEAFPLDNTTLEQLDYAAFLNTSRPIASSIMQAPFGECTVISPMFSLTKIHTAFHAFETSPGFDLIYYDAFGPKIQPELWTPERMEQCYRLLNPGGLLVTYCSQGQFRRNLRAAGFSVEKLPGPPGKREITRATKP